MSEEVRETERQRALRLEYPILRIVHAVSEMAKSFEEGSLVVSTGFRNDQDKIVYRPLYRPIKRKTSGLNMIILNARKYFEEVNSMDKEPREWLTPEAAQRDGQRAYWEAYPAQRPTVMPSVAMDVLVASPENRRDRQFDVRVGTRWYMLAVVLANKASFQQIHSALSIRRISGRPLENAWWKLRTEFVPYTAARHGYHKLALRYQRELTERESKDLHET